jgi:hypothetical protein
VQTGRQWRWAAGRGRTCWGHGAGSRGASLMGRAAGAGPRRPVMTPFKE